MTYTVHELATFAHVSVRTLHHYDEIGLLCPARADKNGYRQYGEAEFLKLQQILFYRELEFPLEEIKKILTSPNFNAAAALEDHKRLLQQKRKRLDGLLKTIDSTLKNIKNETPMNEEELYDAFKDDDIKQYQEEAKMRWGNTDAYKQSQEKVKKMTKAQMEELKVSGIALIQNVVAVMDKGPNDPAVHALIEKHYQGIRFFYDCSFTMYRNLGQMYVDDPRFTAYYEKFRPGLALFMRDAINAFCDSQPQMS